MSLSELGPNIGLLKSPMNWALVLFVMVLMILTMYLTKRVIANG